MKKKLLVARFTLVELLCVCGILIFLMGIGIGVYSVANRKMGESKCRAMIAKLAIAMQNYYNKHGYYIQSSTTSGFYIDVYDNGGSTYPNLNEFIDIQSSELATGTGYPLRGAWKDPFGNQFWYQCPGRHNPSSYDISSRGADGSTGTSGGDTTIGTGDDITNWTN